MGTSDKRTYIYVSRSTSRAAKKLKHFEIHIYIETENGTERDRAPAAGKTGKCKNQLLLKYGNFSESTCVLSFLAGGYFVPLPNSLSLRTLANICVVLLLLLLLLFWNLLLLLLLLFIVFCISRLLLLLLLQSIAFQSPLPRRRRRRRRVLLFSSGAYHF